jgi:hypothetical protein
LAQHGRNEEEEAKRQKEMEDYNKPINKFGRAVSDAAGNVIDKVQKLIGGEPPISCDPLEAKTKEKSLEVMGL